MADKRKAPKAKAKKKAPTKKVAPKRAPPKKAAAKKPKAAKKAAAKKPKAARKPAAPTGAGTGSAKNTVTPQAIAEEVLTSFGLQLTRTDGDIVRWDVEVPEDEHFEMVAQMIDSEQLAIYLVFRDRVPPARMGAVMEVLARVNHGLLIGAYEIDIEDGFVRLKVALDFKGANLDPQLVVNLVTGAHDVSEVYDDAILSVLHDAVSPTEAIQRIEGGD